MGWGDLPPGYDDWTSEKKQAWLDEHNAGFRVPDDIADAFYAKQEVEFEASEAAAAAATAAEAARIQAELDAAREESYSQEAVDQRAADYASFAEGQPEPDPPGEPPPISTDEFADILNAALESPAPPPPPSADDDPFGGVDPLAMTPEESAEAWREAVADGEKDFLNFDPYDPENAEKLADASWIREEQMRTAAKRQHAFWTTPLAQYEPKLKFRFFVRIPGMGLEDNRAKKDLTTFESMHLAELGDQPWSDPSAFDAQFADAQTPNGDLIWYAKTIDKPSYTIANISEGKYPKQGVMATPRLSGSPKFAPIKMTLIDPSYPNATRKLLRLLRRTGWQDSVANGVIAALSDTESGADQRTASLLKSVGDVQIFQIDAQGTTVERWVLREAFPAEVSYGTLDYSSNDPVEISVTWNYTSFYCDFPEIGKELAYTYNPSEDAQWEGGDWTTPEDAANGEIAVTE